jgi:hypothetical protein
MAHDVCCFLFKYFLDENGKMRFVETIPVMGGGRKKENDRGMNSIMIY